MAGGKRGKEKGKKGKRSFLGKQRFGDKQDNGPGTEGQKDGVREVQYLSIMEVIIRKAEEADMAGIHALVLELAEYEQGLQHVITTPDTYLKDFRDGVFDAFLAEKEGEIVGIAVYFLVFSTWRGRMMYLEDFVVKETMRKEGIGSKLFEAFLKESKKQNAVLVKWQVLKWNEPAIHFYKKYDTVFDDEWLDGKIYFTGT
ncbi:MAG TPA: GNAT family N-acetyltransferase [Flavobacterium sp.]|nr:GNAT family N-acetyltransferase [Flavobacterium sp.]